MNHVVYWIAAASLIIPGVLAVVLRGTAIYWLPGVVFLLHAAAACVLAVLLVVVPDVFLSEAAAASSGLRTFGAVVFLFVAGALVTWATVVAGCGAVAVIATARWRLRRGLPARFGGSWPGVRWPWGAPRATAGNALSRK